MHEYTGLELSLLGGLISLLSIVVTVVVMTINNNRQFVRHSECGQRHQTDTVCDRMLGQKIEDLEKKASIQFEMLRQIIIFLPIDKEKQAEILNARGGYAR
ncbi:hypothetical protein N1030_01470 [Desulfovibrio mangrovi]|uniref:hypothetical protein n=1 Tax=Desulfovibrio mangrovi TaxID=2976983 RepID=UPI002247891A|nr:hypothetical protein [Desulfovibrio mangrovi]UZP67663.1 hypothetical protein N1030_01470 [Desulfovibrio mangrovi]